MKTNAISRLICIFVALYFFGHAIYGLLNWEGYLNELPHLIRYLLAPLGFAILFVVIALFVSTSSRLLIGIYTICLLFVFYLVEYYLIYRFYFSRPAGVAQQAVVRDVDLGFTPWRLNFYFGTSRVADAILGHMPFSQIALCDIDYGPVRIHTDRFGLNNPDAVFDEPVRVAVVGDSFVHGHCVPPGTDIVSLTRARVPGTVNMGLTGTGPLLQLAMIGRHVAAVRPPHVVVCFYEGNDLRDLPGELRASWLTPVMQQDVDFGPVPATDDTLARLDDLNRRYAAGEQLDEQLLGSLGLDLDWRDLLSNPTMLRNFAALHLTTGMLGFSYGRTPTHVAEYAAIMERTQAVVGAWGGQLHLCYLPSRQRFGLISSHYAMDTIRHKILQVAADLNMAVIDLTPHFANAAAPRALYASDGHFSIEGSALVAEHLAAWLTERLRTDG